MSQGLFDPPAETVLANGSVMIDCEQHSQEWYGARMGIPTASRFDCIVTSQGKPATGEKRERYKCEMIVERLTRAVTLHHQTEAMERGTALEPQARAWYEIVSGNQVTQTGFVRDRTGRRGGSPDGLILDGNKCVGGIEIKCPLNHNCVSQVLKGKVPASYMVQIQGGLWLTGAAWWDWVLFTDEPTIPNLVRRVEPDEAMHKAFAEHLAVFAEEIEEGYARIKEVTE